MAVFKQAPGMEGAGHRGSEAGVGLDSLAVMDQIATTYWPAVLGIMLVMALVAFGRRDASMVAGGLAFVLQATLVLSTQ
jgi:hypothetical protein